MHDYAGVPRDTHMFVICAILMESFIQQVDIHNMKLLYVQGKLHSFCFWDHIQLGKWI